MSLASMFTSLSIGVTGKEQGYLKLPSLPKDENHFAIWKLKVEAIMFVCLTNKHNRISIGARLVDREEYAA